MKVQHQKNVYFIDLNKNIYEGYIETKFKLAKEDFTIDYKFELLDICSVHIKFDDMEKEANYEIKNIRSTIEKYKNKFDKKMWNEIKKESILKVDIPKDIEFEEICIRIKYKCSDENPGIIFYSPTSESDEHKEIIGTNYLFDSSLLFPSVVGMQKHSWELVYIIPNNEDVKIISPGTFKSLSEEEDATIHYYTVSHGHSGHINFCVGTYDGYEVSIGEDKKLVFIPKTLESFKEITKEFCTDVVSLIKFTEHFLQREYTFKTLHMVFTLSEVEKVYGQNTAFTGIGNLTSCNDIEPGFLMKYLACDIISSQIFYFYFSFYELTDFWIFEGLKGYFYDYCVRYLLGNNEFLYNLKKDRDFVAKYDVYELALYDTRRTFLSMRDKFFRKKSKVFFHILESNLSKAFMEKIANYALKRKDDVGVDYTCEFIKLVKDISGKDLRPLFEFYVFKPGAIKVKINFTINKKNNKVDLTFEQEPTSKLFNANQKLFTPITLRSYEIEGVFEHSIDMEQEPSFYYHARTKKKKKVEDEEEIMPLLWIRADPKGEHLMRVVLEQPDYMYIEQLLDKNVTGQMEALERLSIKPSLQTCEIFERILENAHVFYKIRINVMYIMAKIILDEYSGPQKLIQFFVKKYCVQTSTIVKPNDFQFIPYFLQYHLVKALSFSDPFVYKSVNNREISSASIICAFILNILKFNDNSSNLFSDGWYISSVIGSLSYPASSMHFSISNSLKKHGIKNSLKESFIKKSKDEIESLFSSPNLKDNVTKGSVNKESEEEIESLFSSSKKTDFKESVTKKNEEEIESLFSSSNLKDNVIKESVTKESVTKDNEEEIESLFSSSNLKDNVIKESVTKDNANKDNEEEIESFFETSKNDNFFDDIEKEENIVTEITGINDHPSNIEKSDKNIKIEANDKNDYVKMSIEEIERLRILDMVFPSHKNIITKSCIYALGRLALFEKIKLSEDCLLELAKYPNYTSVRLSSLEVLLILHFDNESILEKIFEKVENETYFVKRTFIGLLLKILSSSKFDTVTLKAFLKKRIFGFLEKNFGNIIMRSMIVDVIYYVYNEIFTEEEYCNNILSEYQNSFDSTVCKALNKLNKEVKKVPALGLKVLGLSELRKKLLLTEYVIKIPVYSSFDEAGNKFDKIKDITGSVLDSEGFRKFKMKEVKERTKEKRPVSSISVIFSEKAGHNQEKERFYENERQAEKRKKDNVYEMLDNIKESEESKVKSSDNIKLNKEEEKGIKTEVGAFKEKEEQLSNETKVISEIDNELKTEVGAFKEKEEQLSNETKVVPEVDNELKTELGTFKETEEQLNNETKVVPEVDNELKTEVDAFKETEEQLNKSALEEEIINEVKEQEQTLNENIIKEPLLNESEVIEEQSVKEEPLLNESEIKEEPLLNESEVKEEQPVKESSDKANTEGNNLLLSEINSEQLPLFQEEQQQQMDNVFNPEVSDKVDELNKSPSFTKQPIKLFDPQDFKEKQNIEIPLMVDEENNSLGMFGDHKGFDLFDEESFNEELKKIMNQQNFLNSSSTENIKLGDGRSNEFNNNEFKDNEFKDKRVKLEIHPDRKNYDVAPKTKFNTSIIGDSIFNRKNLTRPTVNDFGSALREEPKGAKIRVPVSSKLRIKKPKIQERFIKDTYTGTRPYASIPREVYSQPMRKNSDMDISLLKPRQNLDYSRFDNSRIFNNNYVANTPSFPPGYSKAPSPIMGYPPKSLSPMTPYSYSRSPNTLDPRLNGPNILQSTAGNDYVSSIDYRRNFGFNNNSFDSNTHSTNPMPSTSYTNPFNCYAVYIFTMTTDMKNLAEIDNFISSEIMNNDFFSWNPLLFRDISNGIKRGMKYYQVMVEIEKSLVFILSYSSYNSEIYKIAKEMFLLFERGVSLGLPIIYNPNDVLLSPSIPFLESVAPMTDNLRRDCMDFLNRLINNEIYYPFVVPVDLNVLVNYKDIVRTPMSLEYIKKKLPMYKSLEAFINELKQITKNCLYYNHKASEICGRAFALRKEIEKFYSKISNYSPRRPSFDIVIEIIMRSNEVHMFNEVIMKIKSGECNTFGSLLILLKNIERRYSYGNENSISTAVVEIKKQIYLWFNLMEDKLLCWDA